LNITERWCGVVKLTSRLILLGLKRRKKSHAYTLLSVSIVKESIKPIEIQQGVVFEEVSEAL